MNALPHSFLRKTIGSILQQKAAIRTINGASDYLLKFKNIRFHRVIKATKKALPEIISLLNYHFKTAFLLIFCLPSTVTSEPSASKTESGFMLVKKANSAP